MNIRLRLCVFTVLVLNVFIGSCLQSLVVFLQDNWHSAAAIAALLWSFSLRKASDPKFGLPTCYTIGFSLERLSPFNFWEAAKIWWGRQISLYMQELQWITHLNRIQPNTRPLCWRIPTGLNSSFLSGRLLESLVYWLIPGIFSRVK